MYSYVKQSGRRIRQFQPHRAVVSVNGVGQHPAVDDSVAESVSHGCVVDVPAFVVGAGTGPITPPAIRRFIGVFTAKRVGRTSGKPAVHPGPFVGQKSAGPVVFLLRMGSWMSMALWAML